MRKHTRVGIRLVGHLLPSGQVNTVRIIGLGNADHRLPGTEIWELDGWPHREGGPAVIDPNGTRSWWFHGQLHREDGPAIIDPDGYEVWYLRGRCHREDGPARIWPDGSEEYWENGRWIRLDMAGSGSD